MRKSPEFSELWFALEFLHWNANGVLSQTKVKDYLV